MESKWQFPIWFWSQNRCTFITMNCITLVPCNFFDRSKLLRNPCLVHSGSCSCMQAMIKTVQFCNKNKFYKQQKSWHVFIELRMVNMWAHWTVNTSFFLLQLMSVLFGNLFIILRPNRNWHWARIFYHVQDFYVTENQSQWRIHSPVSSHGNQWGVTTKTKHSHSSELSCHPIALSGVSQIIHSMTVCLDNTVSSWIIHDIGMVKHRIVLVTVSTMRKTLVWLDFNPAQHKMNTRKLQIGIKREATVNISTGTSRLIRKIIPSKIIQAWAQHAQTRKHFQFSNQMGRLTREMRDGSGFRGTSKNLPCLDSAGGTCSTPEVTFLPGSRSLKKKR